MIQEFGSGKDFHASIYITQLHMISLKQEMANPLTWNFSSKSALRILLYTIIDLPFDLHPWTLLPAF